MSKVEIIGAPQSSYVRAARIAAEEKGVDYELRPARPHTPEILAIHPLGKMPAMRHGDVELCESMAIAAYFDRAFPGPRLIPEEPVAGAKTLQWASLMVSGFQNAFGPYVSGYFFPGTADGAPDRARIDAALGKVEHALDVIERGAAATGHLVGDGFTLADIMVLPALSYLKDLPESGAMIAVRLKLAAYIERHSARPSLKATIPPPLGAEERAAATQILKAAGAPS